MVVKKKAMNAMGCQCQSEKKKKHEDNISKWSFAAMTLETISVLLGPFVNFSEAFKLWNFAGVFSYGKFTFLYIYIYIYVKYTR